MTTTTGTAESTLAALRAYSDNPSGFLALNREKRCFTAARIDGVVVYRPAGRHLIQFGGPFAAADDRAPLLRAFLADAGRRPVMAVQLQHADAQLYAGHGFTVNQIGSSYAMELPGFTLRGGRFMQLRNKISRAHRSGIAVTETTPGEHADAVAAIDRTWLRAKGWHVKQLEFLVGELDGPGQPYRRLFLASMAGRPMGYISYSPVYGTRSGWLHDLSRRTPGAPPGTMEAINMHAIERFRAEGARWLHFGFTPFAGLDPELEVATASGGVARFVRLLAAHGERVYPSRTQVAYKHKWQPQAVLPEYLAFHGRPSAGAIWRLLRVTRSV